MKTPDFESVEDLKKVVRSLSEFVNDAIYGRIFELPDDEENLFFSLENGEIWDLAKIVRPGLRDAAPEECAKFSLDLESEVNQQLWDLRVAFMTIGIFLGAAVADPSGSLLTRLGDGWIKSILAQPGYVHLRPPKENE